MKKKETRTGVRHLLAVLTITCFALMLLAAFKFINIAPVREGVSWLIVPLQNGVSTVGSLLGEYQTERRTASELQAENSRLEEQIKALEAQNLHLTESQDRLEELEELFALDKQYFEYDTAAAQVIAKEPGRWYNTFTINRGTSSGITEDMNVLCQEGLAGIVTEAGTNWAKVRAVADDSTKISAMLLPTGDSCIISGDLALLDEGKLRMSELRTEYNVVTGTKVVTSQISDKYLPGLLIGYVDSVEEDPNHLTRNGKIIPAVDFEHIRSVLVILETKQDMQAVPSGEEESEISETSEISGSSGESQVSASEGQPADTADQDAAASEEDQTSPEDAEEESSAPVTGGQTDPGIEEETAPDAGEQTVPVMDEQHSPAANEQTPVEQDAAAGAEQAAGAEEE